MADDGGDEGEFTAETVATGEEEENPDGDYLILALRGENLINGA